jgi:acetyl-CoA carboxylase biotin carboxyl carrier protein
LKKPDLRRCFNSKIANPKSKMESPVPEGEQSNIPSPFDVRTIKYLVRLMGAHDLTEIDLREGDLRIRLRRGAKGVISASVPASPAAATAPTPSPQPATTPTPGPAAPEAPAKNLIEIKSPTPGTFYAASSPEAEPFARIGTRVNPDTVVCIIEAMKVFNEIPAECTGAIVAIMVENQQPVEYGQVLFKVDPAG